MGVLDGTGQDDRMRISMLTEEHIESIDRASIQILESTGIAVYEKQSLDILERSGARVDRSTSIVRIPERLIRDSLESIPEKVILAGRSGSDPITLGSEDSRFLSSLQGIEVLDIETGEIRPSLLSDVAMFARIVDSMNNIDIYGVTVVAHDVPGELHYLKELAVAVENTSKHVIHSCLGTEMTKGFVRIAEAVSGGPEALIKRPAVSSYGCPVSPLQLDRANTEAMVEFAKAGVPYTALSAAMAGASSPMSLAGTLALLNAEVLASVTICELFNPGTAVIYGSASSIMDMRTGVMALGAPERAIINTGTVELAHHYGMPAWSSGLTTDAKMPGEQAMMEKVMTGLPLLLAGSDIIIGPAMLSSATMYSPEQLVVDNEAVGALRRIKAGIKVDSESLALEAIDTAGPGGGYIGMRQTLEHFRKDIWVPVLVDRNLRENWTMLGKRDLRTGANEIARKIMKEHRAKPLEDEQKKEIEEVLRCASQC
jgi:trimethylamine--corrinoid protein Co-methyltransferase